MATDDLTCGLVSFGNGHAVDGYLAAPADGRPHPGVVLIQEWWGLDDHIKRLTERLAREGFVVLAPDLYHGNVATQPDDARKAMMALDFAAAVDEIGLAIDFLRKRPDVQPKQVGVTGFCMGGLLSWRTAERMSDKLGGIAPFYGGGYEPTAADIRKIGVPVLAVWGAHDASIPTEAREAIVKLLEQEGKVHKVIVADAGHAFLNDTRPAYHAASAEHAWNELVAWFKTHLG